MVLTSGGLDSVTALYDAALQHEVCLALSFDYGSKHNHRELPYAELHSHKLGVEHKVVALDFFADSFESSLLQTGKDIPDGSYAESNMKQTVVPFRNGIMISIAAGIAESRELDGLVIATHAGAHPLYPDCGVDFMNAMGTALKLGTYTRLELMLPFITWSKDEIVKRGFELNINLSETWSCYKGGEYHCGECGTCIERKSAFQEAGLKDPTVYLTEMEIRN